MKNVLVRFFPSLASLLAELPRWVQGGLVLLTWMVAGYWASEWLAPAVQVMPRPADPSASPASRWLALYALPESHVSVQLHGLVATDETAGGGVALLALDNGPTRAFHEGREVAPGILLQHVGRHDVTLTRNTGNETLTLAPPPDVKGVTHVAPRPH